jgi:Zn2+/Cd2+-exporting ATPase
MVFAMQAMQKASKSEPKDRADGSPDRAQSADLHTHDYVTPWWWSTKGRLTIAAGLGVAAAFIAGQVLPAYESWAYALAMAIGLVPIARRAIMSARYGAPFTIEMLMTIAAMGAVAIGAVEEAAVVVFLFLVGELLEGVAAGRARASIRALTNLVPKTAHLERDSSLQEIPAERAERVHLGR